MLYPDLTAINEAEIRRHAVKDAFRDIDRSSFAVGFHQRGHVYGVAPNIICEAVRAYDAGNHRAGMDTDANLKVWKPQLSGNILVSRFSVFAFSAASAA